jgi:hypothetical protein
MGVRKWIWLLGGWLMALSLVGCGPMVPTLSVAADTGTEVIPVLSPESSSPQIDLPATPLSTQTHVSPSTPVPVSSERQAMQEETVAANSTLSTPADPALQKLVMQAKEDLAQRISTTVDRIELVESEAVEWPDASLGCPEPGKIYVKVITPGARIVLAVDGKRYEYHTDTQQRVVYCESQGMRPVLGSEASETVQLAREDLARRLEIPIDSIAVVAVLRQEFPAEAFYCRTTKSRIARDESPVVVSGETILLSTAERKYEYHASDQMVIFCRQLP